MNRRQHLCALALLATSAAMPLAAGELALPSPEAGATTLDFDWHDSARNRAVPVRLYLPADADPARPLPLVVFSHGIGGSRLGYSHLGRFWASRGHASLHVQHVGSDRSLWAGNPFALVTRLQQAANEREAIARVHDLRFALDQLLGGPLAAQIDAERIVAAGHSYGANTTLLAAGAQVQRDGKRLDFRDPRIKAALILSAPPFYGETDPAAILASVTVPTLHITATDDVIRIPGYYSGANDRIALFEAIGSAHKALVVFAGGSHSVFTDRAGTGGAALNPQLKAATQALSLAFLKTVFDHDDAGLREWQPQYGPLVARYSRSGF